jgi:Immunity protein 27
MKDLIIKGQDFYKKRDTLKEVKVDSVNWVTYYIDEMTGEKWVEEYPYPEMQAGGPPQLRLIAKFPWET